MGPRGYGPGARRRPALRPRRVAAGAGDPHPPSAGGGRRRPPPAALGGAAGALRVDATGPLGRLVRWRIPGLPDGVTFRGLFAAPPFAVLGEGERWSVSGLVGRIWTLRRDYPQLDDAEAFRTWSSPGTARV